MGKGRDRRRRKNKVPFRPGRIAPQPLAPPEAPPDDYASVLAPIKPKPSPRSGAIALPEPEEPEARLADLVGVTISK